jgi:parallel beta-helix repeat protein
LKRRVKMRDKLFAGVMLAFLLVSTFTLAFTIQPVEASGTIVIEADGSVNPPSANITSSDNITYTFTDNNYDNIVVERSNIVVDGNGYTLKGSGSGAGFELVGISNVTIKNTNIKSFMYGVYLYVSSYNTVSGNNITDNGYGVRLASSSNNNTVSGNTITNSTLYGVNLYSVSDNKISGNTITKNTHYSVFLLWSSYNTVSGNTITNNTYGVVLSSSFNNTVSGNTITNNASYGVMLASSSNNTVSGNNITNNTDFGVYLSSSSNNNTVSGNTITNNTYGVYLDVSSNNTFYHNNFIDNTQHVYIATPGYPNYWNSSYPSGGNYWSNYAGVDEKSGPNQDEAGSDGIGDTPHVLDAWNQDNYPYMNEGGWVRVRNINTTLGYWAIQEAIDASETLDGHTILVDAGTYFENVDVTKQLNIVGAGAEATTVEASNPNDHVFYVTANNVNISGFTVKDATGPGKIGVCLYDSDYSKIENINASNNYRGIRLSSSSYNTVSGNTITNNNWGVSLFSSSNNTVSGNNITNNTDFGVYLSSSSNNNTVSSNTITNNTYGIYLHSSSYNTVSGNTITDSTAGVYLYKSSNNTFYHNNFIDNTQHVYIATPGYPNYWNSSYPSGGNYWSNYNGVDLYSGPHQNETGNDGIGDTSYVIAGLNQDNYPLMKPYGGPYDIGITNIATSKTVVGQGYNVTIIVKILNYGINTETFNITAYANTTVIDQGGITLPSRNSTTITFTWNTTGFAYGNYTINAVADTILGETDTTDNTRTCWVVVTIQGDVNGDYIVDGSDLFDLNEAYGSTLESPNWNPNCDLDNDNKVDALDLFELSKNYGKTNPEVLFSTLAASASMIVALVAYVALKTLRKKRAQD